MQQEVAEVLGWSLGKVSNYAVLEGICNEAWQVIATKFENSTLPPDDVVAGIATTVAFSERLLRPIINLTPEQQLILVSDLASNAIRKTSFRKQAENYVKQKKIWHC